MTTQTFIPTRAPGGTALPGGVSSAPALPGGVPSAPALPGGVPSAPALPGGAAGALTPRGGIAGALVPVACLALLLLGGCATQHPGDLKPIQDAYNSGDYRTAYQRAHAISNSPLNQAAFRQQAAYYAGLSANRLHELDTAQWELTYAAQSRNPALAADAQATLGLVYSEQGRYGLAADALLGAAPRMERSQDRANAYYYGGIAQQKMGRWPQARVSLSMAMSLSRDPAFRDKVAAQLRVTGYTLQVGAYEVENNAHAAADNLADRVTNLHMGRPRIVPSFDPYAHRRLYLVQVGQFTSWPTALTARDTIGMSESIVVPLAMR